MKTLTLTSSGNTSTNTNTGALRRVAITALATSAVLGAMLGSSAAIAQAFPNKPVKLVVTYPPGGSSDLMARIMGQKLNEVWNQPVVIESKPGAAGAIGMEFTARQPADGYTFVIGNMQPAAVNPLITKVPYSMEKDFIPVALTTTGPNILWCRPTRRSRLWLICWQRRRPGPARSISPPAGRAVSRIWLAK